MFQYLRYTLFILTLLAGFSCQLSAQEDHDWRITPILINVQVGDDRPLQLINDTAEELTGAEWSVDDPKLGELEEMNGHQVLHPKEAGTLHVTAIWQGQARSREINIWPADQPLPEGISKWSMQDLGHEIKQLAAVPSADGPSTLWSRLTLEIATCELIRSKGFNFGPGPFRMRHAKLNWFAEIGWAAHSLALPIWIRTHYMLWVTTARCGGNAK